MAYNKNMASLTAVVVLVLIAVPLFIAVSGLIFQTMWCWFVVPLGVPMITLPHAIGLAVFVNMYRTRTPKDGATPTQQVGQQVSHLIMALLLASVAQWMM